MYKEVLLRINNFNVPNKSIQTIGPQFYRMQLLASDLEEFGLRPTDEFEDSMTEYRVDPDTQARNTMSTDATSFVLNFQTERNGGGAYFDGLLELNNVTVEFRGTPMYSGDSDIYYTPDLDNPTVHSPTPRIAFTNDALFTWTPEQGLQFHGNEDINAILNEVLAMG
jgi:hypothetical protein